MGETRLLQMIAWRKELAWTLLKSLPLASFFIAIVLIVIIGPLLLFWKEPMEELATFLQVALFTSAVMTNVIGSFAVTESEPHVYNLAFPMASFCLYAFLLWPIFLAFPPSYHFEGFAFYLGLFTLVPVGLIIAYMVKHHKPRGFEVTWLIPLMFRLKK